MKHTNDPLERLVSQTLDDLGIPYNCPDAEKWGRPGERLDFYVPSWETYIECKAYGTSRIHPQVENVPNCIVLIGMKATKAFCDMLRSANQTNDIHTA